MGHVQIIRDFHSPTEGMNRTLRIFTPSAYDHETDRKFPVLYMHDGQNVFAHPESARYDTWCANTTMERLVADGQIEPWIIVGIDHSVDRFKEYSPWDEPRMGSRGGGAKYAEFLVDHLKPFIDQTYRTRVGGEWTATMGASLGGLISLYLGLSRSKIFGRIGAVSPSVMWANGQMFRDWKHHTNEWSRIYIDAGTEEYIVVDGMPMDYGAAVRNFFLQLKEIGYQDHEAILVLEEGGQHHESDWQRRLPDVMRWLLR
jgi:predicted alpha/beta superfamily hydrolase